MQLAPYLKEKKITQAAFGEMLDPPVTQALVSQWIRGQTQVTLSYALQIERQSNGAVTCKDWLPPRKGRVSKT